MPSDKKKIAKNAILLYFRMGIVLIVSLYTARVVLQNLGASDYGTYNVVGGVVTLLNFMTAALSQGVQRFYNFHKGLGESESINKVLSASFIIMLCVALVIMLLAETVGLWFLNSQMNIPVERMGAANWVYQFSIITMVFNLLIVPHNALIVAHEDFNIYALLGVVLALCNLGVAFLLDATTADKLIFYAALMCAINVGNAFAIYIITRIRYKKYHFVFHKDKSVYSSLLSFSGWNILGVSTNTLSTAGVNIILKIFFGTIVNAARGIAVQISSKVDEFINNIQVAMNPQIVQIYARGEKKELESLIDDNFRWNFALYWMIALPLLFEMNGILKLWLGEVPPYTEIFTLIIVCRSFLKCFERPINSLNFAVGEMKQVNLFSSSCTLASVILTCILFSIGFPPYWAFLLDIIAIATYVMYFIIKNQNRGLMSIMHLCKSIFLPILLVIVISGFTTYFFRFISPSKDIVRIIFTLCITTLISGLSIYFILLTANNREILKKKIIGVFTKAK